MTKTAIMARKGRGKIHWVALYDTEQASPPEVGETLPRAARTLCSQHYCAEGWTRVDARQAREADGADFCRLCD